MGVGTGAGADPGMTGGLVGRDVGEGAATGSAAATGAFVVLAGGGTSADEHATAESATIATRTRTA